MLRCLRSFIFSYHWCVMMCDGGVSCTVLMCLVSISASGVDCKVKLGRRRSRDPLLLIVFWCSSAFLPSVSCSIFHNLLLLSCKTWWGSSWFLWCSGAGNPAGCSAWLTSDLTDLSIGAGGSSHSALCLLLEEKTNTNLTPHFLHTSHCGRLRALSCLLLALMLVVIPAHVLTQ